MYHKWRSYDIWFLKYRVWQTEIFDILDRFLPFQPIHNLGNQNFNIEKNTWRYYHFKHLHHKWESYDVWFLRYGVQQTIFRHSGPFFALLPAYRAKKLTFSKKWKKHLKILSFYKHKWQSYDGSPAMECNRKNFLSFWPIFCPFTSLTTQKI